MNIVARHFRSDFEEPLEQYHQNIEEDESSHLFIDELHTIVGSGIEIVHLDAANILKPALARGTLRTVGWKPSEEYKTYRKDAALSRHSLK